MAADLRVSARLYNVGRTLGDHREAVFLGPEPLAAAAHHRIDQLVRDKFAQTLVVHHVRILEIIVFRPRAAVGDDHGRRVVGLRLRDKFGDIFVDRLQRHGMLVARKSVDHLREIELHIERALGSRRDLVVGTGHRHPLPHVSVADHIFL